MPVLISACSSTWLRSRRSKALLVLVEALVDSLEARIDREEALVDVVEARIDREEALVDVVEAHIDRGSARRFVEVRIDANVGDARLRPELAIWRERGGAPRSIVRSADVLGASLPRDRGPPSSREEGMSPTSRSTRARRATVRDHHRENGSHREQRSLERLTPAPAIFSIAIFRGDDRADSR
jgi:hypothetical protein